MSFEKAPRPEVQKEAVIADLRAARAAYDADLKRRTNEIRARQAKSATWEEGDYDYEEGEAKDGAAREHFPFVETLDNLSEGIEALQNALNTARGAANKICGFDTPTTQDAEQLLRAWQNLNEKLDQLPLQVVLHTKSK